MSVKVQKWADGWYVVIHFQGRRYTKKCRTETEAVRLAKVIETRITTLGAEGLTGFQQTRERIVTFAQYAEGWLKAVRSSDRKETTVSRYASCLNHHLIPEFGRYPLEEVTYARLRDFCLRKAADLSRDSVRLMIATMRLILKEAVREKRLPNNPASGLGRFYGRRGGVEVDPFRIEELHAVLEASRSGRFACFQEFILCLARAGLRFGEARALFWEDVDLRQRKLHIRRNWPATAKEASPSPKTRHSYRKVDMSRQLVSALKSLRARRLEAALAEGKKELSGLVFLTAAGTPVDYANFRRNIWDPVQEAAGIRRRRIHDLRHTFATHLLLAGEHPIYVARQLGHSMVSTTLNIYAHWIQEPGDALGVDRLDDPSAEVKKK